MTSRTLMGAAVAVWLLSGCAEEQKPAGDSKPVAASAKDSAKAPEKKEAPSAETKEAKDPPAKPDPDGLEKIADAVKFTQAAEKDGKFTGKLANTSEHTIKLLEYKAFAYDKDGKLLELVEGKHQKALEAGKDAEIEVGPFKAAAGKEGVTIEVVVSWMNVDGTSYQRPVPKDRAKGGPNNALKK